MTLFDPGLQPERTELAWRRTALTVGVGSLVTLRLLPAVLGHAAWSLVGVAGLLFSATLWLVARIRYRAVNAALARDGDHACLPDGRLAAVTAAAVSGAGVGALALLLFGPHVRF